MSEKLTACKDCVHCEHDHRAHNPQIWYNYYCKSIYASSWSFDCIEGRWLLDEPRNCQSVNTNGHCQGFEAQTGADAEKP